MVGLTTGVLLLVLCCCRSNCCSTADPATPKPAAGSAVTPAPLLPIPSVPLPDINPGMWQLEPCPSAPSAPDWLRLSWSFSSSALKVNIRGCLSLPGRSKLNKLHISNNRKTHKNSLNHLEVARTFCATRSDASSTTRSAEVDGRRRGRQKRGCRRSSGDLFGRVLVGKIQFVSGSLV